MALYTIYCDCEAIIKNIDDKDIHQISGFNISVVSEYEETQLIIYRGDNAGEVFWSKMEKLSDDLYKKILNANAKMVYTDEDKKKFQSTKKCHICEEDLPVDSTKLDHLENMQEWLKILGLRRCMPKLQNVKKKKIISDISNQKYSKKQKMSCLNI